jgi:hypothetical protein
MSSVIDAEHEARNALSRALSMGRGEMVVPRAAIVRAFPSRHGALCVVGEFDEGFLTTWADARGYDVRWGTAGSEGDVITFVPKAPFY